MSVSAARSGRGEIDFDVLPLWRTLLKFSLPFLGSSLLQSASPTLLSILLGRILGVTALAVISIYFPFGFFLISFVMGLAGASSILISQAKGAGDDERVLEIVGTMLMISLIIGASVACMGTIFASEIFRAANTPENILPQVVSYGRIMFLSQPLVCLFITYTTCLRGAGDTHTPFYMLILFTVLMLTGAAFLVHGWWFLPSMGVSSGALAMFGSYILSFGISGIYLRRTHHLLAPTHLLFQHLRLNWQICKTLIRLGVPGGLSMVMISLSEVAVLSLVNGYGAVAIAAYGAVNQVASYIQFPAYSVGISAGIFGARAIGRSQPDQLGSITHAAMMVGSVLAGTTIVLLYIFGREVLSLFVTDQATVETALRLLHITLWAYLLFSLYSVMSNVVRSSGDILPALSIAVGCIWLIQVPSSYILAKWAGLGLDGIWYGYDINFVCMAGFMGAYYHFVWRHKTHQRLV